MSFLNAVAKKLLGSQHLREAKKLQPVVDRINAICNEYQTLSETDLKKKTQEFRDRISDATAGVHNADTQIPDATILRARVPIVTCGIGGAAVWLLRVLADTGVRSAFLVGARVAIVTVGVRHATTGH